MFHNLTTLNNDYKSNLLKNYEDSRYKYINKYYGITQHPITQNFMIIMEYHKLGDLTHYIADNFFDISWYNKLNILQDIIHGLKNIHNANIIHKDYHSGNIFIKKDDQCRSEIKAITGDLGLSAIEQSDNNDNDEIYGIIPFVAPEVLQGQKYTKASDIYSIGMIMWELMIGRRPFWNQSHDTELIIEICDGLRPPISTNAPKDYTKLMKECWHSDPNKRPTAAEMYDEIEIIWINESNGNNSTKIIKSSYIGPISTNNPGENYKSNRLNTIIKSVECSRSLRDQSPVLKSSE
jgi:serine/threonine protein kinase